MGHVRGQGFDETVFLALLKYGVIRVVNVVNIFYRQAIQLRKTIKVKS